MIMADIDCVIEELETFDFSKKELEKIEKELDELNLDEEKVYKNDTNEVTIKYYYMSYEEYESLPEFSGW
jgi:hypothetical protein